MRTASVALLFTSSVVAPVLGRGASASSTNDKPAASATPAAGTTREQASFAEMDSATLRVMDTSN